MANEVSSYTPEQVKTIVDGYLAGVTVEALSELSGKNIRSVIAKLAREGVYVAKIKKEPDARVTKDTMIKAICLILLLDPKLQESMEKMTYPALSNLHEKIHSCDCNQYLAYSS